MTAFVFWIVVVSLSLNLATTLWSIARPASRIWPPPGEASWQYRYTITVSTTWMLGFLTLGVVDRDTFLLDHPVRMILGGTMIGLALLVSQQAVRTLSLHATKGLARELVTDGPYRYSRNPQYLAYIGIVLGYALVCNSTLALVAAALATASLLLGPFSEERWLRERFGVRYQVYAEQVPRFLGRRRSRTISSSDASLASVSHNQSRLE